jgi:hypothetical protein
MSNIVRFFQILTHFGSGFDFLVAQVILGFGSFGSGSGQVSGHLISSSLSGFELFRFGSGRIGFFFVMFYFGSD